MAVKSIRAERLNIRLFIEGVELPCISATVTHAVHGSSTAYVQLVATDAALKIRARSVVEVYILQNGEDRKLSAVNGVPEYYFTTAGKVHRHVKNKQKITADGLPATAALDINYDLLFYGEATGFTFYTDGQSRTINLMCMDLSANLDSIIQYSYDANDPSTLFNYGRMIALTGYSTGKKGTGSVIDSTFGDGKNGKNTKADTTVVDYTKLESGDQYLDVLVDGVIGLDQRLAKLLGDFGLETGMKIAFKAVANSYAYYRDVDELFNIRDSVYTYDDDMARRMYKNAQFIQYIFGHMNNYGSSNSLKNIMKIIFKIVHFDFSPLPGSPFYMLKNYDTDLGVNSNTTPNELDPKIKALADTVPALKQTLLKPEMVFAEPPACNVIFPDEMNTMNVSRHFLSEPTRGVESTDLVFEPGQDQMITNKFVISPSVIIDSNDNSISYSPQQMVDLSNNMASGQAVFGQILLPEEILKGILPINSFTSHLQRSAYVAMMGGDDTFFKFLFSDKDAKDIVDFNVANAEAQKLDKATEKYFIREANYKFLYSKYQPRTASISAKLLTRLVPGFTVLAMEKAPLKALSESDYYGHMGYLIQVTHFVSQAGGVSSLSLSHVRPTNEYMDFFNYNKNLGSVDTRTIIPDFRYMGMPPWSIDPVTGVSPYNPDRIYQAYSNWLGGMSWDGSLTKQDATPSDKRYLGVLPLSQAIYAEGSILTAEDGLTPSTAHVNPLRAYRKLVEVYRNKVLLPQRGSTGVSVEEFGRNLTGRPVANRLQMRGYLKAYESTAAVNVPVDLQDRGATYIQQYLIDAGYFKKANVPAVDTKADGDVGENTLKALAEYQKDRGLQPKGVTGVMDKTTLKMLQGDIQKHAAYDNVYKQNAQGATTSLNSSVYANRVFRRQVRRQAVDNYAVSLDSIGGGKNTLTSTSRGLQG